MSTVDERVVILEFNNAQFESGVKQSVSTLQKLKESLNLEGSAKGLDQLNKSARSFNMTQVADNVQTVADRFSALGIVGDQVLRRLTDKALDLGKSLITAIPNQIITGGKRRAQNIEQAKFMLEGLLGEAYDWEKIQEDINYAVSGTAFGFDEAASAAGQLAASSVEFGDDMKAALRGISGVAAMTNDEYTTIAQIFTKIAGQGKVMTQELNQLAAHGINAAATLAKVFGTTEAEIRELVHDGEVGFADFAYAMDTAFGEHAKNANATFQGVLRNVKASLSRMGEQFATPAYDNLRLILVALLPVLKDIEAFIKPISAGFTAFAEAISGAVVPALENLHYWFAGIRGLQQDYDFSDVIATWAKKLNGMTREQAQELGLFDQFLDAIANKEQEIKDSLTDVETGQTFYDSTLLDKDKNAFVGAIEEIVDSVQEGEKMDFNPLLNVLDSATKTADTLEKVEENTEKVEKAVESVSEANKEAEASAEKTQKEYKKTSKYAKTFSNVQEAVANSTKSAYKDLTEYGTLGKIATNAIKKLTKEEEKRAQVQADLSTNNARNEKIAIEMSERSAAEVKKENLLQQARNKIYQGATGFIGKAAQAAADFLGFNKDTVKALASEEQMQQVIDDLANRTWMGEFGNGEERKKALVELGAAYSIVQNRVNELLDCEKRHTVTAEDEAQMMEYVCKTLGISSAEGNRITTILDALTKIFAGIIGFLEIIKTVGLAIFNEIIKPFAQFAFQSILALILPPLGAIGDAIAGFYASLDPEGVTKFFSDIRESIVGFWNKAQELEGVKKLKEAWETFKAVLDDFRKKVLEKITTKFEEFRKNFKLPEGSFFLNIIDNITNALSGLVDILSVGVMSIGEFFSPLFDWVVSIPDKLKEFWDLLWNKEEGENAGEGFNIFSGILRDFSDSVNSFIDSIAPLKAIKDFFIGFWDTIFGKKEKEEKGIFGKMFGEADEKVENLRKAWNEGLNPFAMISPFEELKKRVDEFTNSIAPLKAVKDWMKDFWKTIFGTPGEGEDPASYGFGAAFEKLKQQISDFMEGIPILKTIKDWFLSVFNENLSKSISEIGKAISEFFSNLFGKAEEGAEPVPFGEKFITAAEGLKEKIVNIFGSTPELGKLLMTGGGLGAGILGIVKLISSIKGNQNGEDGIAGAIFGSARGGIGKIPLIIGGLLGLSAAFNTFGIDFKKVTEDGEKNVLFIEFVWDKLLTFLSGAVESIKSLDIGGNIYKFLFGDKTKKQEGDASANGLVDNITGTLKTIADAIKNTIGVLFGDKEGRLGLGNSASIIASVAGLFLLMEAFKMLGKALSGVLGIFTGAAGILGDLRVALTAYSDNMRANTFLTLAKALGVFALGLALLAMVPKEGLSNAVAAVSTLAIVLSILMGVFSKLFAVNRFSDEVSAANTVVLTFVRALAQAFRTAATMVGIGLLFTGIALAVIVLVGAINKLASINNLDKAMSAFAEIMALLAGLVLLSSVLASGGLSVIPAMAGIAVGLLALSGACYVFSQVDGDAIGKNLGVIAGALITLMLVSAAFSSSFFQFLNWETGAQFALIAGGLILFAYSCKVLESVKPEAIAAGLFAMAVAILGLGTAAMFAEGGSAVRGGSIAALSIALLGLAAASILIGNNIEAALAGLVSLAGAFLVFALIGNLVLPPISVAMASFNASLLKAALGVVALGIALPILGQAFSMFGKIFFDNILETIVGFIAFVATIALLGVVSSISAPGVIALGQAMLMVAAALAIIVGVFTDFKGIRALIGEISGGIGDIFAGFFSLPGNMLSMFTNTSRAVKESGNDYVVAADSYRRALSSVEGLSSSVINTLGTKLEELQDLDGSGYWIGVRDIVTYIKSLDLDEKQKNRVIERTLRAAEMQQKEKFSLIVYNIELSLRQHGANQDQIDAVFGDLQDMFNKAPGAITAKVFKIHTLVEELNLPKADQVALETTVDSAIQSTVKFKIALKNLRAIVNQSTTVSAEGKKLLNAKIDEILSDFSYKTNIDSIEAWIKTSGIDVNNILGFQVAVKKAIAEKSNLDFTLGTIYALVNDQTVVEANEEDVITAINEELNSIYQAAAEGEDVEEVRSKIENVKIRIQSIYPDVDWEDGVETDFETYVNNAFSELMSAYEGYHASLRDLKIIFDRDGNLGEDQWNAFTELLKGIWSSDPIDIGELWVECEKANMSKEEIMGLFNQLGITLSEQNMKDIELSGVRLIMHKAEVPEEQQKEIEKQLETLDELPDEVLEDAEAFMNARNEAIQKIAGITGSKALAVEMVETWFQEKKDLQDAGVGVLGGMLESMIFGTDTEAIYFQNKLHTLYGLYGNAFATEMKAFIDEIKESSSLSDEDKTILEEQAGEILRTQKDGLDKEYLEYLEKEAEVRRKHNIGQFSIDQTTGASIGGNTVVSKLAKKLLDDERKNGKKEFTPDDFEQFIEEYNAGNYTWDQLVGSFEDTGMSDEEIAAIFFPHDLDEMEMTYEGYQFMQRLLNPWLDGTSRAYQDELKKYGKYDFSSYYDIDEKGHYVTRPSQQFGKIQYDSKDQNVDRDVTFRYTQKQIDEYVERDMEKMAELVRKAWREVGPVKEDVPVSLEDMFEWYMDPNGNNGEWIGNIIELDYIFDQIDKDITESLKESGIEEGTERWSDEYESALRLAFINIRAYLYRTGDGIIKETEKTMEEIEEAYASFYNGSNNKSKISTNLSTLRGIFDNAGLFGSEAELYDFLKSNVIGYGPTFGLKLDELLEGEYESPTDLINTIVSKYVENMIPDENGNTLIDTQALIQLYKAFPNIRQYFIDFLKNNPEISKQLGPEFNSSNIDKLIQEEVDDIEKTYNDAAEKVINGNKKESEQGKSIIQQLLESNLITPNEMASWNKSLEENGFNISGLGEAFGIDTSNLDTNGISNAISGLFEGINLNEMMYNNGSTASMNEIDGMVAGLEDNKAKAVDAQREVAEAMDNEMASYNMSASPSKLYKTHGLNMMTGLKLGIVNNKEKVIEAIREVVELCSALVQDSIPFFKEHGSDSAIEYGTGVVSHPQYINLAGATVVRQASDGIKTEMDGPNGPEEMGKNFTLGFAKGITNTEALAEVTTAANSVADTANSGITVPEKIESPSRVTMQYGRYFSMGFAIGIRQFGSQVEGASREVAEASINALGNPLAAVQSVLDSDLDYDPTIRPVMDISGIQNGVKTINGMMPNTKVGLDFISNSMNRVKTTNEDVVSAISGLSKQMEGVRGGDTYTVNGVTYDDGSNISTAVKSLIHAARVERRR